MNADTIWLGFVCASVLGAVFGAVLGRRAGTAARSAIRRRTMRRRLQAKKRPKQDRTAIRELAERDRADVGVADVGVLSLDGKPITEYDTVEVTFNIPPDTLLSPPIYGTCKACGGAGTIQGKKCEKCGGIGVIFVDTRLRPERPIKIPYAPDPIRTPPPSIPPPAPLSPAAALYQKCPDCDRLGLIDHTFGWQNCEKCDGYGTIGDLGEGADDA